jgi:hypothetical protein
MTSLMHIAEKKAQKSPAIVPRSNITAALIEFIGVKKNLLQKGWLEMLGKISAPFNS